MGGVAAVLHEHALQRAVRRTLAVVEDEPKFELVERARPGEIGNEIGADEGRQRLDRRRNSTA